MSPYNNNRLPFEVLGSVFEPLAEEGPLQLRGVLHVCKAWHSAVVLHRTLWTSILVDLKFTSYFGGCSAFRARTFISQCVQRSGALPLSVELKGRASPVRAIRARVADDESNEAVNWSPKKLMMHFRVIHIFDRCISLKWDAFFIDHKTLAPFLRPALPVLRHLQVKNLACDVNDVSLLPHCPRMDMVTMSNYEEKRPSFSPGDVVNVKTLTFHNSADWFSDDILVIGRFSSLHSLVLATGTFGRNGNGIDVPPSYFWRRGLTNNEHHRTATLPCLTFLHIHGEVPAPVLYRLDTPSLLNLHVTAECNKRKHSMFIIPQAAFRQYPSTLTLLLESPFAYSYDWVYDFVELVESMPNLQTVYISPAMASPYLSTRWKWEQAPMNGLGKWLVFTRGLLV